MKSLKIDKWYKYFIVSIIMLILFAIMVKGAGAQKFGDIGPVNSELAIKTFFSPPIIDPLILNPIPIEPYVVTLPPSEDEEAVIRGTLTACGQPAAQFQVVAYEVVRVGFPIPPKPCRISPRIRNLGAVTLDNNGFFNISYSPTPELPGACFFSAHVRIDVFDGAGRVWQSPNRSIAPVVRFDAEVFPGCTPDSTVVRVVDDGGRRVHNAEVFLNGMFQGRTNGLGLIAVDDVSAEDTLAARMLILENETSRDNHDIDSDQNWNYRVYITSVPITHDANGDNVELPLFQVKDPSEIQELRVSRNNTQIGLNLRVSVEWDATTEELTYYRDRLFETSELIYNATDGQFLIEYLEISDNASYWDEADIRIYANLKQASNATVDGFAGSSGRIRMNPYDSFFPGTLMHELGHYAFGLRDEYKEGDGWDPSNGPVRCTLASTDTGTPFANGNEKDSCVMRGARFESHKKFCSAHPDNPHVDGTLQGSQDCWSAIFERYNGFPDWRLLTPVNRGAIVGRLGQDGNYIPLSAWKPRWHIRNNVPQPNECPNLIARVVFNNLPVNGARVTLKGPDGRRIYQGTTGKRNLPDNTTTSDGEITVRGAHEGDTIQAIKFDGSILVGSGKIMACGADPVEVSLRRVGFPFTLQDRLHTPGELAFAFRSDESTVVSSPISLLVNGADEPYMVPTLELMEEDARINRVTDMNGDQDIEIQVTAFDADGDPHYIRKTVTLRTALVESELHAFSLDGQFEVLIPNGCIATPVQLAIEEVVCGPLPPLEEGDRLLVGPYRIGSTAGDELRRPGFIYMNVGDAIPVNPESSVLYGQVELLAYDEKGEIWHNIPSQVNEDPFVVSASVNRLGMYALVERKPQ